MHPQYSPLHGGLHPTTTQTTIQQTSYPTGLQTTAPMHPAHGVVSHFRRGRMQAAIAAMTLALISFIVACASPGWLYSDSSDSHMGLWHGCIGDNDCQDLSDDHSSSLRAARAFSILQCIFAFISLLLMIAVMHRLMRGHTLTGLFGYGMVIGSIILTFILAVIAFVVGMHALNYYDESGVWNSLGWCWGLMVAGLALTLISLILFAMSLSPRRRAYV